MKKSSLCLFTCFSLLANTIPVQALALDLEKSFSGQSAGQAEYFNSNKDKRMLIRVNILSGVAKPGTHEIPDNTNLLDALALAGGFNQEADFSKVYLKRKSLQNKNQFETMEFDVEEMIQDKQIAYPALQNNDTILIDPRPKTDQRMITALTIIATTVSIIGGVILIKNSNK